jgi:hypothetical protein
MFKVSLGSIPIFWLLKYCIFYLILMFKNDDYTFIRLDEIKTGTDLLYYLFLFLFMPVISSILLTGPVYLLFKVKKLSYFIALSLFILIAEYCIYTYFASSSDLLNGLYNGIISVLFFLIFYFRRLKNLRSYL